jgi:hypothetical protein
VNTFHGLLHVTSLKTREKTLRLSIDFMKPKFSKNKVEYSEILAWDFSLIKNAFGTLYMKYLSLCKG